MTGALPNRPTKERKRLLVLYFTNTQTYILYKLFGSTFTIKYHPTIPNPYKYYPLLVLKIYEPPDLFLSLRCLEESKAHSLRCGIGDVCAVCHSLGTWQSCLSTMYAALPSYTFTFLCLISSGDPLCQRRQPADPVAFI